LPAIVTRVFIPVVRTLTTLRLAHITTFVKSFPSNSSNSCCALATSLCDPRLQGLTYIDICLFVVLCYLWQMIRHCAPIRALSAHSAAEFNTLPVRWQHVWLVAIVPPKRWGEMDRNDCHTAWGNFKTLIYSLHHYKNYAWFFLLIGFFKK
jgi:hypothetical protein